MRLDTDRARAAVLEFQILDLERALDALRAQKALVQERIDSYKYPILSLPNEITSEIFMHFLPIYPLCPPLTGPLSPTLLTHICREWREIALTNPAIWRSIAISRKDARAPFLPRVHTWLSRSGCCPLSIKIEETAALRDHIPDLLAAFVPHRVRWEYADLCLSSSHVPTVQGPIPLLRHFNLAFTDEIRVNIPFAFVDTPLLRTVILDYIATTRVTLSWAQLTSLTLKNVFPHECAPLLQQTSNLVHCDLGVLPDDEGGTPGPDITLPCLESLTIKGETETGYLETFIVPALRRLDIGELILLPKAINTLESFMSKSGCQLREVLIAGDRSVHEDLYRKAFPILKFSFSGRYVADEEKPEDEDSSDFLDES
ncbi:hypothetical protein B0H19DRAFT_1144916 [Mycena capillaripes]|nr:hypothetical protein B0H19DRAFT_1144916 [Mycena capillaripes]